MSDIYQKKAGNQDQLSISIFCYLPSPSPSPNIIFVHLHLRKEHNLFIMAGTVTYILKDPKATSETPVNLMFWYDQLRFKIAAGEKIDPKNWNSKTRRASKSESYPQHEILNTKLDKLEEAVLAIAKDHLTKNQGIRPKKLRVELVNAIGLKPTLEPISFFESIQECIDSTNIADSTKTSYTNTLKTLQEYNSGLTFDSINLVFYQDFITHLKETKNLGINTIGTRIKNLKTFMNYALEKGYTTNLEHQHKKFKKIKETTETIYLNKNELSAIYALDLPGNPRMNRARDMFLIGKHTGLRFADFSPISSGKTKNKARWLKLARVKASEAIVIPLHWTIKDSLKNGNGETPHAFNNLKMNEYIEELASELKLNERIKISKRFVVLSFDQTSGNYVLITEPNPRGEVEANLVLNEVPAISIMKLSGAWKKQSDIPLFAEIS